MSQTASRQCKQHTQLNNSLPSKQLLLHPTTLSNNVFVASLHFHNILSSYTQEKVIAYSKETKFAGFKLLDEILVGKRPTIARSQ